MTPAEFTRRATRILDDLHASIAQRERATRVSLLMFAGRSAEVLAALAELATGAESHAERQRWLDLADDVLRGATSDASGSKRGRT